MTPAATPPMSAAPIRTRVFGMKAYMKANTMITITYGTSLPEDAQDPSQMSDGVEPLRDGAALGAGHKFQRDRQQDRPDDHDAQVLGEATGEAARTVDLPDEIEAGLHFLDRADDRVDKERQADGAEHIAAHVRHELQHVLRQLIGSAADRMKEFLQYEPQIAARARDPSKSKS